MEKLNVSSMQNCLGSCISVDQFGPRGDASRHLVQNFHGAHRGCCGHGCSAYRFGAFIVQGGLAVKSEWIRFLTGTGAIVLTFLAGAELDPKIFRTKWKESTVVGLVGFFGPFLGCKSSADDCR